METKKNNELRTEVCVVPRNGKHHLGVEVMRGIGVLYTILLFELYDHEMHLKSGRFVNYDGTIADNQATCMVESTNRTVFAGLEFESIGHLVKRQVEWCAETTQSTDVRWNLSIDPQHINKMGISFFFDDVTTAVTFKLLWS